jgi:hypothetical protein
MTIEQTTSDIVEKEELIETKKSWATQEANTSTKTKEAKSIYRQC